MYLFRAICPSETTVALVNSLERLPDVGRITHHAIADASSRWDLVTTELPEHLVTKAVAGVAAVDGAEEIEVTIRPVDDGERFHFADGAPIRVDQSTSAGLGISVGSSAFRRLIRVDYQYILLMVSAAVVATAGMIGGLPIAVVGAMAFSPDLGRLNAMAFAVIAREWRLLIRGSGSLAAGLTVTIATSAVITWLLSISGNPDLLGQIPERLVAFVTVLDGVTITVALGAGVAAMVVFITDRGRAAVGVGVSITTMPAAAFVGVAVAEGDWSSAGDALLVLFVNVVCVVTASVATGLVLRGHFERRARRLEGRRGSPDGVVG